MFKSIFVLESSWDANDPTKHASIMPFIYEFAKQRDIKAYHQVFTDKRSFEHWIKEFNKISKPDSLLYIASHGNRGSLDTLMGRIQRKTVVTLIKKANKIKFIHFGSCLFGNMENLRLILNSRRTIRWVAGYSKTIDWVDSTLFDLLLWGRICHSGRYENKGIKTHTLVRDLVDNQVKGLVDELGFEFAYRYGRVIHPK